MNEKRRLRLITLDSENAAIQRFVETNDFQDITLCFNRNLDADLDSWVQIILKENPQIVKLYILDTHLSNTTVVLATAFLRKAIDVCVVYESMSDQETARLFRVFHCGGLCMSLADLSDEMNLKASA